MVNLCESENYKEKQRHLNIVSIFICSGLIILTIASIVAFTIYIFCFRSKD